MEKESWRRNHGGGILEKESGRRNHGGGILEEQSWRHLGASGGIWEATGKTWEAPGGSLGLDGPGGYWKQKVATSQLKSKKFAETAIS